MQILGSHNLRTQFCGWYIYTILSSQTSKSIKIILATLNITWIPKNDTFDWALTTILIDTKESRQAACWQCYGKARQKLLQPDSEMKAENSISMTMVVFTNGRNGILLPPKLFQCLMLWSVCNCLLKVHDFFKFLVYWISLND